MNKNNQCKKIFNRFWNYYKSNRSLLLIIIVVAALSAITVQAAVNTQQGTNVNVQFEDEGINITFAEVTESGNTSVDTSLTGPDLPYGYDLVGEYRKITTTAKYAGNTSVCIDYSDTKIVDESALKLFHHETGKSESIVYVQNIYRVDSTWDISSAEHPSLLYFDFDEGDGCENLHFVINGHDGYTINGSDNNFLYSTSIYDNNGESFIAWLGKQFCVIDNGVDWNISKVLTDENEDDTHLIEVGESLSLPGGFAITPFEINDNGINTRISITQNGDEVYNLTINEGELFVYKEDLNASGIKDNWVLRFNVETVIKEMNSEVIKINKTQLISPDVVTIRTPDSDLIPDYNITSQDSDQTLQIKLNQTSDTIQLYEGRTVSFLDNSFRIRINEDGNLGGLVVVIEEPGIHEIFSQCQRLPAGEIVPFSLTSAWDPSILYYDFDEGDGAEVLNFSVDVDEKQIKGPGNFLYETSIYDKDGEPFIAWLGEPYYVVSNEGSDWYLSELLIDEDEGDTHLLAIGQTLTFGEEGLALTPVEIDVDGGEVWFTLTRDGEEVDSSVIKEGNVYKYEEDLNESYDEDNWVLKFILETASTENNTILIKINSTQLVSTEIVKVETPDSELFDDFEVTTAGDDTLRIKFDKDDDNITLTKGNTTSFLNDRFHFRTNEDGDIGGIYTTIKVEKAWRDVTKSLDTDTNTVCGNVTTLSEFIIAGQNIPEDTNRNGGSNSGGGSSSGGTGASGEARENILITETEREYVYNGVEVCYSYDLEGNIVQYINFKGLINAGRIGAKVEILNNTSTLIDTTPPNKVYKNLNIFLGNSGWATSSNIANPTISFTVEKSWIIDEKIDKSSIKMYRYSSGKWNELSTSYITEEADCLHFKSETPGFSSFAIVGEQVSAGETDTDGDSGVTSTEDGDNDTTNRTSSDEKTGLPGFCVLTSLLVILMAVRMLRKK
jgi:PGF-pre-PGF domain-containing protein